MLRLTDTQGRAGEGKAEKATKEEKQTDRRNPGRHGVTEPKGGTGEEAECGLSCQMLKSQVRGEPRLVHKLVPFLWIQKPDWSGTESEWELRPRRP